MKTIFVTLIQILFVSGAVLSFLDTTFLNKVLIFALITIYVIFENLISPLISRKKGITYSERLKDDTVRRINTPDIFDILTGGDIHKMFFVISVASFLYLSARAGKYVASTQKTFLTYKEDNSVYVVIKEYGEDLLSIEIDPITKQVKKTFNLIPHNNTLTLKVEEIGPLKNK